MIDALTTPLPPYAYNLIGVFIVLIFTLRGFKRGIVKELSGIISLGASIVLANPVGEVLIDAGFFQEIPLLLKTMAAASIAGMLVYVVFRFTFYLLVKFLSLDKKGKGITRYFVQCSGACLGGLFGAVLVFILGWYILLMGSLPTPPPSENSNASLLLLPGQIINAHKGEFAESYLGSIAAQTNPVPENVTKGIEVISALSEDPANIQKILEYEPLQEIATQESVQALMQNEEIRALAEEGNIMELLNNPDVKKVLEDPAVQEALKNIDPSEMMKLLESE